jgi:hypothetical protein
VTEQEYEAALARIEELMARPYFLGSPEEAELLQLVVRTENYAKARLNLQTEWDAR